MIDLAMCVALLTAAVTPVELYNQGNKAFAEKDYAGAVASYAQALQGLNAAVLHYNLGNAYFKAGDIGKAVASYRRAHFLAPRDPDINYNLLFARQYRLDRSANAVSPLADLLSSWLHYFSYRESFTAAAILALLCAVAFSLYRSLRKRIFAYLVIPLFIAFMYFGAGFVTWRGERSGMYAIVIAREAHAMSGPGIEYKEILLLHDGTEMQVKDVRGDYLLIQLPGGLGGWVNAQTVEFLYP
ncbi:MAG TPA: tetratricopeptide repeat protein [bacterium]